MSILIRDMEMPTSCAECRFCVNGFTEKAPLYECACESTNGTSVPVDYDGKPFEFRPDWCPLEEVAECGDAVSREAVLDALRTCYDTETITYDNGNEYIYYGDAVGEVEQLPPVTPKQRMGKWIRLDMHRGMADHKCTACEQECYVPTCMGEPLYAFCPNCGSYNGGEQDDSV